MAIAIAAIKGFKIMFSPVQCSPGESYGWKSEPNLNRNPPVFARFGTGVTKRFGSSWTTSRREKPLAKVAQPG
jgi:hypothetical protein